MNSLDLLLLIREQQTDQLCDLSGNRQMLMERLLYTFHCVMCFWEYRNKLSEVSEPAAFPPALSPGRISHLSLPKSPKSDNIQNCILPSQKHLTHQEGKQMLAHTGALALGFLELDSLPILLIGVRDLLLARLLFCSWVYHWPVQTLCLFMCLFLSVPSQLSSSNAY